MAIKVAIYTRVSTEDQTCLNQTLELRAEAERRGWVVVKEYTDHGVSGAKDRTARPGLDEMLKGVLAGKFKVVMCWSVDRLARSLMNLLHMMADFDAAGVDLYLHQQAIDTTSAGGRAMFQMIGVFAEFERSLIRDRVKAGMARAMSQGRMPGPKGIEISDPARYQMVRDMLVRGVAPWRVHRETGTGHSTVLRIKAEIETEQREERENVLGQSGNAGHR
jgi:DNA invertase Pin-like site-specific DNA recombinase